MNDKVKIEIKPRWEEIAGISDASASFLRSHGVPADQVETFAMVVVELVENGLKYGAFHDPQSRVTVHVQIAGGSVIVEVTNPFEESTHPHLQRLDRMIQWIRGYQDPFEAYVERLKQVAGKPLADEESGLGLARIAYEGRAILDFFTDGYLLNVSAISGYN